MANRKVVTRVQIDAEEIRNAIKVRRSNISELASTIGWSSKSIHRALKTGEMNLDLYMDIHKWMDPNSKMEITIKRERPEDTKTNLMVEGLERRQSMFMNVTDSAIVTEHIIRLRVLAMHKIRAYSKLLDVADKLDAIATGDPTYGMFMTQCELTARKEDVRAHYIFDVDADEAEIWDDLISFLKNVSKDHHAGDEGKE